MNFSAKIGRYRKVLQHQHSLTQIPFTINQYLTISALQTGFYVLGARALVPMLRVSQCYAELVENTC